MSDLRGGLPLPHAYPFLLLEQIVEIRAGVRAVALRNLTRGDPLVDAEGALPSVLLAEALAQCAGLAVHEVQPQAGAVLARIDRFRSRRAPVAAGDQLRVEVRIVRVFGATVKARGVIRVNGRIRAAGEVVLQLSGNAQVRGTD